MERTEMRSLIAPTVEDAAISWRLFEGRIAASYEDSDQADADQMLAYMRDRQRIDLVPPAVRIALASY